MPIIPQHQYITNWHDSFVDYIGSLLGVVAVLMARPEAENASPDTDASKQTFVCK